MNLLTRYLIKRLAIMSCYALFAILALYSFLDFLNEMLYSVGRGEYSVFVAIQYVLMFIPKHAYEMMPLATLIGGLVALNQLSSNSEWAVIKTSGLSTRQILAIIVKFSLIFAVFTVLLGEWIAPKLSRQADTIKAIAKYGNVSSATDGVWLKHDHAMVNVASMLPDNTLIGIKIWRYDDQLKLIQAIAADKATVEQGQWQLNQVRSSTLNENQVKVEHLPQWTWQTPINNQLLNVLLVQPEQMSFTALTRYISYLKDNKQQTQMYDVAWWNKLVYPIATMVMAMVALAFTPLSGRNSNMGLKLFGGVCLGLLFFFTGRLFGFTSQLYHLPAFIAAFLPTVMFALLAFYLIRKQEQR